MGHAFAYTWVDVFALRPFAGNPLCCFTDADGMTAEQMATLTRELGHSETTFLQQPRLPGAHARIRIWIPQLEGASEVAFAGHPILGSAAAFASEHPEIATVRLETEVGLISVEVAPRGDRAWEATMIQPLPRLVWSRPVSVMEGLAAALGLAPADLRSDLPVEAVDNGLQTVIIPLVSVEAVERAAPDLARLREILGRAGLSTMIFAPSDPGRDSDLYCRVFSPFDLVPEDPATGSANGPLGRYVYRHRLLAKERLVSEQGHALGRPGQIQIGLQIGPEGRVEQIQVGGRVHLVGRGSFTL